MPALEFDNFNPVAIWNSIPVKSGEAIADQRGKYVFVDDDGLAYGGAADTAAEVGEGPYRGLALNNQRHAGSAVEVLRWGLVDVGSVLDSADPGDPVYVSDVVSTVTGLLTLTSGESTELAVVGYVYPQWQTDGTLKKLLEVNTLALHVSPA